MNKIKRFPSWSVEAKAGLILGFTALTLAGSMTLINNKNNQGTKNSDDPVIVNPSDQPIEVSNNTEIVVNEKIETLVRPYLINATIARHYYDMNDESVYNENPYGEKIGNGTPFNIKSKDIDNAISESIYKILKKK